MMAGIWIVHEVIDDRVDDLVIWAITTLKYAQLPFKDPKQTFNVIVFSTENLDHVSHAPPVLPAMSASTETEIKVHSMRCTALR